MNASFRKAGTEDEPAVLTLLTERHNEAHPGEPSPFLENGGELFRATVAADDSYIVVGELGGVVVSTMTVYILPRIRLGGYFAMFESVVVSAGHRGNGIGTAMLRYAIGECKKDARIKKIKLGSRKDQTRAHAFYEHLGFVYAENLYQLAL